MLPSSNHIDSTKIPTIVNNDIRDGWDNDEWGSLEEEPVIEELEEKLNDMNHHSPASRSNSNSHSSSGNHHNNNHNSVSPSKDNGSSGGDNMLNSNSNSYSNSNWDNHGTSWNDDEFEPIDDSNGGELRDVMQRIKLNNFKLYSFLSQQTQSSTKHAGNEKRKRFKGNERWKLEEQREVDQ